MTTRANLLASVSRHLNRNFSAATVVSELERKLIPTRHSRHAPPPACLSSVQLYEVTHEVLESSPGILIPYKTSVNDDSNYAWKLADNSVQKVEWLIRGYSARIKNSIMNNIYCISSDEDPALHIVKIKQLMKKLEKEGTLYMDLRQKMRSQLVIEARGEGFMDDELHLEDTAPSHTFASPGLTIGMIDTLLDSMAVSSDPDTPSEVGDLFSLAQDRFMLDGGMESNSNEFTIPTQLTFNAVLRAIANSPNVSEKTRDDAIVNSVTTFDALRDTHLKRNSATYTYMIQTMAKFMPPSEMAGNIALAMWFYASEDQVIDTNVMKAMELVDPGDYPKYRKFLDEKIRGKTTYDVPQVHRKYAKSFRYKSDDDTY